MWESAFGRRDVEGTAGLSPHGWSLTLGGEGRLKLPPVVCFGADHAPTWHGSRVPPTPTPGTGGACGSDRPPDPQLAPQTPAADVCPRA